MNIENYKKFSINIKMSTVDTRINRIIKIKKFVSLSFYFVTKISIQMFDNSLLSIDKNYIFHFEINFQFESKNNVLVHVVNVNMFIMQIRNVTNTIITINRHVKFDRVFKNEKKNLLRDIVWKCSFDNKIQKKNLNFFFKLTLIDLIVVFILTIKLICYITIAIVNIIVVNNIDVSFVTTSFNTTSIIFEIVIFRNIIIYDDNYVRAKFEKMTNRFFKL